MIFIPTQKIQNKYLCQYLRYLHYNANIDTNICFASYVMNYYTLILDDIDTDNVIFSLK